MNVLTTGREAMTKTEDHLRAALKRSRKAHKATIEQARRWRNRDRLWKEAVDRINRLHSEEIAEVYESRNSWRALYEDNKKDKMVRVACFAFVAGMILAATVIEAMK
jgi:hypothetical protein